MTRKKELLRRIDFVREEAKAAERQATLLVQDLSDKVEVLQAEIKQVGCPHTSQNFVSWGLIGKYYACDCADCGKRLRFYEGDELAFLAERQVYLEARVEEVRAAGETALGSAISRAMSS